MELAGPKNFSVSIQRADERDLEVILELQKRSYLSEARIYNDYSIPPLLQTINSIRNEFRSHVFLKAVWNDQIVGSVRGCLSESTILIGKLIVDDLFQNQGIGQRLMDAVEKEFPDAKRAELFTGSFSLKNLYLYQKLGYREFRRVQLPDSLTLVFLEKHIG